MSTSLYSYIPTAPTEPNALRTECRQRWDYIRTHWPQWDTYPPLPWTLEDMPGTIWRNLGTGCCAVVGDLEREGRRRVIVGITDELLVETNRHHIGHWSNRRYVIDNWTRVDQLPLTIQLAWYQVETDFHVSMGHDYASDAVNAPVDVSQRELYAHCAEKCRRAAERARARGRLFALEHQLSTPDWLLTGTGQMVLF